MVVADEDTQISSIQSTSKRAHSLDSGGDRVSSDSRVSGGGVGIRRRRGSEASRSASGDYDRRANSTDLVNKNIMQPLRSEEVNPFSPLHPLSHLRSCSEFRKDTVRHDSEEEEKAEVKMGNLRRLYRWAQKKTGLRKSTAEVNAERAFHERRAMMGATSVAGEVGAGFGLASNGGGTGARGDEDKVPEKKKGNMDGHAQLLVSAVEKKTVEKPRAPSVVSVSHLPRPNAYSSTPKWMKHPKSGRGRACSTESTGSTVMHARSRVFPGTGSSFSSFTNPFSKNSSQGIKISNQAPSSSLKIHKGVTYETQVAMNVLFGYGSLAHAKMLEANSPMDIELKELKPPRYLYRNMTNSMYGHLAPLSSGFSSLHHHSEYDLSDAESGSNHDRMSTSSSMFESSSNALSFFSLSYWLHFTLGASAGRLRQYLTGPADEMFYDAVRIQPFSSGAYLRGFLMSGFSSLFFHTYSLAFWKYTFYYHPDLTDAQNRLKSILLFWLCAQLTVNLLQFPLRLYLHISFFESSRSLDMETSIGILRTTLQGDTWILCRALGWLNDAIAWTGLLCIEWYLWTSNASSTDPMRSVMIALSSTVVMAFIIKMSVALVFAISQHDPQVLLEARKRGLSRLDLDTMPTFVFTKHEDLNLEDCDCSICMTDFTMGEMLICLPCDKRHSFHASCIREWLTRQNSCPLCQKTI